MPVRGPSTDVASNATRRTDPDALTGATLPRRPGFSGFVQGRSACNHRPSGLIVVFMNATNRNRIIKLVPALAVGALALPACNGALAIVGEKGSGTAETTTFSFDDVAGVHVGHAFDVEIRIEDGPTTVEVTVDDNFTDDLDVKLDGDHIDVTFDSGSYRPVVEPTAIVTVSSLEWLDASGAAKVDVVGEAVADSFVLDASGASSVAMAVQANDLVVDASGASHVTVDGEAEDIRVDASGASDVDLSGVAATTAYVDASGASSIRVAATDDVDGRLSGASSLTAPRGAVDDVDTSGASSIDRD